MPRTRKKKAKSKAAKVRRARRSREEVTSLLKEIDSLVSKGATIKDALKKLGVSYSSFNYWRKREGKPPRRGRRTTPRAGRRGGSLVTLLNEMMENRRQAEKARRSLADLDARFDNLKKQLEKAGS